MPSRPAVPAAAYGLVATIVSSQAILQAQGQWAMAARLVCAALGCAMLLGLALRFIGFREMSYVLLIASFAGALGCGSAAFAAARCASCAESLGSSAVSAWSFELVSDMTPGDVSWRGRAVARGPEGERGTVWLACPQELSRGEEVRGVGRFKACDADEWGRNSTGQGISGTVSLSRVKAREEPAGAYGNLLSFRDSVIEVFCPTGKQTPPGALLAGLVCGYAVPIKTLGLDGDFAACGASHLIAVSGSHLALISSLLAGLIQKARARRAAKVLMLMLATGAFVVFCGAPLSAVRSWLMSIAAGASELAGRRGHSLSALSLMGCAIALVDPTATGQMGFILSLLCVGGLCLFGRYAEHLLLCLFSRPGSPARAPEGLRPHLRRAKSYVYQSMASAIVCQAVCAPVCLPAFGKLSLVAPIANVALGALFTPVLALGALAAALVPLSFGGLALAAPFVEVGRLFAGALLAVLGAFADLPFSCVATDVEAAPAWAACLVLAGLLLVFWPKPSRRAIAAALGLVAAVMLAHLARWRFLAPAAVCVMDVGQADAVLVRDGASSLLVDAGLNSATAAALARNHVLRLDAVVLTHLDEDHVGGLDDLVGLVDCGRVYVASGVAEAMPSELEQVVRDLTGDAPQEIAYGETLRVGGFSARMVWPSEPVSGDANADSVVLGVVYAQGDRRLDALLTGDAEKDQLDRVLEAGDVGDIDLLKVGHHGSAASITAEQAAALLPEVSVASAGEGNRYGHPRQECVDALESSGSLFLCTKDAGDVTVAPGVNGPQVSCAKRSMTTE